MVKLKRIGMIVILSMLAWVVMILTAIGGLLVADRALDPKEDSGSMILNCHIYGDGECGPSAPWHGFINLF